MSDAISPNVPYRALMTAARVEAIRIYADNGIVCCTATIDGKKVEGYELHNFNGPDLPPNRWREQENLDREANKKARLCIQDLREELKKVEKL